MGWDNRKLHINGDSEEMLAVALQLAFDQYSHKCSGWRVKPNVGLYLDWHTTKDTQPFLTDMIAREVAPLVHQWLTQEYRRMSEWDNEPSYFDGGTSTGWELFLPASENGYDYNDNYAICVVKPVFLYYGK